MKIEHMDATIPPDGPPKRLAIMPSMPQSINHVANVDPLTPARRVIKTPPNVFPLSRNSIRALINNIRTRTEMNPGKTTIVSILLSPYKKEGVRRIPDYPIP